MDSYELTDRGKIAIAVVIALVLIALSVILVLKALAAKPPQQPEDSGSASSGTSPPAIVETTPPEIADSPPPSGGGFNPPGTSTSSPPDASPGASPNTTPPTNGANTGEPTTPTPSQDNTQSRVDAVEGKLSFQFSSIAQSSLDTDTTSLLGTFLRSPKNTRDSYIIVEMPQLQAEEAERLVAAVVNAFAGQGVSEQRLAFSMNSSEMPAGAFEVNIYYVRQPVK